MAVVEMIFFGNSIDIDGMIINTFEIFGSLTRYGQNDRHLM